MSKQNVLYTERKKRLESNKTIWLIQQHSMPPELGHYNRQNNFGKHLKRDGYRPIAFAGSKLHNSDVQMISDKRPYLIYEKSECPFVFIKTLDYGKSTKKRILADFQFHWNIFRYRKKFPKPDVILGSSSYMLSAVTAIILARKFKCKSIVEVRDLWPETIVDYLGYSHRNPIIKFLYRVEKWMYDNADEIVFTMEGGRDYIIEHNLDKSHGGKVDLNKVHNINNGVDLEWFSYCRDTYHFEDTDLLDESIFKVIYIGSIRRANDIGSLLNVAKRINNPKIKFLIWGDGDYRESLEKKVESEKISNVVFKGKVDKKYIPYIVSQADLNLAHNTPSPIFKYGISLNKMFDYFAAGKPVLSDFPCKYNPAVQNMVGIDVSEPTIDNIVAAINYFADLSKEDYATFCENAKTAANKFDFSRLSKKLEEIIDEKDFM